MTGYRHYAGWHSGDMYWSCQCLRVVHLQWLLFWLFTQFLLTKTFRVRSISPLNC